MTQRKGRWNDKPVRKVIDFIQIKYKTLLKLGERQKEYHKLENIMAKIRLTHELSRINLNDVYNFEDPQFPGELPIDTGNLANDPNEILEIRKLYSMNIPELQNMHRVVLT